MRLTRAPAALACLAVLALVPAYAAPAIDDPPVGVSSVEHLDGTVAYLSSPQDVELVWSGGKTYALVVDGGDNAVSAFDVTDPDNPGALWSKYHGLEESSNTYGFLNAHDIDVVVISSKTYAVVTSKGAPVGTYQTQGTPGSRDVPTSAQYKGGLQILDITDPSAPIFASYTNQGDADADGNKFDNLAGAGGSAIFERAGKTYVVTGSDAGPANYGGMQVSDISDPAAPKAVSRVQTADANFGSDPEHSNLEGDANKVDVVSVNGVPYALLTASGTVTPGSSTMTGSLTVISLADPAAPAHVSTVKVGDTDSAGGKFDVLFRPSYVAAVTVGGTPYAVVAASVLHGSRDGLQVVDLSDPAAPKAASSMIDGKGFEALGGARGMHADSIGGRTYLFAPSYNDDTVSIIDLSDPSAPSEVSRLKDETVDSVNARCGELAGTSGVDTITVGGRTYALVTAALDEGVQMLDVTDPSDPRARGVALNDTLGFAALSAPIHVEPFDVGPHSYLAVTDFAGQGVQIIDVTNPEIPEAVSTVFNGGDERPALFRTSGDLVQMAGLWNPRGLDTFTATARGAERTYAVVASSNSGDQNLSSFVVMDLTVPSSPSRVFTGWDKSSFHPQSGFEGLKGAADVAVYEIGGKTYAAVSGLLDPAVQIVDLTDPYAPTPAGLARDNADDTQNPPDKYKLKKPYGIDVFTIASGNSAGTYAAVAAKGSNGVQIIKVDDPDNLEATAFVADTAAEHSSGECSVCLSKPNQVKAVTIDVSGTATPHLLVSSQGDNGAQIIDVSDPDNPELRHGIPDGYDPSYHSGSKEFTELNLAYGVDTFTLGSSVYGAVTCQDPPGDTNLCSGVQIIGLDNPAQPVPTTETYEGRSSTTDKLFGARGIATFERGDWTYAAVAGYKDAGVQILRLGGEADSSAPVLQSAVLLDDEVLVLTFDDLIDVSETDLDKLAVSETGQVNQHKLGAAALETASDGVTLRIRLTTALTDSIKALSSPQLDIAAAAVENDNSVDVAAAPDQLITKEITRPAYHSGVLDLSSGVLIMTFDMPLDAASIDPSKMSLHEGGTKYGLDGSDTLTSLTRSWASVRLSEQTRQAAVGFTSPVKLDLAAGAVSGSSGGGLTALEDAPVRVLPDDRHPKFVSARVAAGVLSVTFDETLDMDRTDPSKLTLVAGDDELALSGSSVTSAGDSPTATLALAQDVADAVAGADPLLLNIGGEAVWDTSGNHVLEVLRRPLGVQPEIVSAEAVSRGSVTVSFTVPVTGTGQLHTAWRLHGPDAQGLSFASSELDGDSITLLLNRDFPNAAPDVEIEYQSGGAPLVDGAGRELAAGRVPVADKIAPGLLAARASSLTSVEVEFTEPVSPGGTDGAGWAVSGPDSAGRTVTAVAFSSPAESAILTLSGPLADTSPSISLSYDPAGGIQDLSSNPMPADSLDSVADRIPPAFVSASLQGSRSFLVTYSEDVESAASHYASISSGTSTVRAESVIGSPGSSILVVLDPSSATFSAGTAITFTILSTVADLAGNALTNPGQFQIPASETAQVARLVLSNPGNDGRSELPLTDDTLVRTVVVQRGTGVDLDVSSLTGVEAAHPRVASAGGGTAAFPGDLTVSVATGTVTFQSGLQVGGLADDVELIRVGTAPAAELPAEFASSVRLDTARAATVLELGDPSRTLWFSEPVRIDLAEPLSEIVYVIRPDGARQVLSCGTEVGTPDRAESAIAALAQSASADADSCFSGERAIWTRSFSLWGSGPVLPPEPVTPEPVVPPVTPEPEPEPEPEPAPSETVRRGGGGGGGGGSLRGPATSSGPSDSAYVATVSWDCSASLVTVTAGPDSDGLSVSVISSVLGSMQAQEDPSARQGGLRTFTAPMSANEDFLQVTAMHISARDFVQDRRSVNLDQCQGSQTFWTPPRASAQQGTAPQTDVPDPEPETMPDPAPEQQRQDREPQVQQCPAGTVMGADGRCSAPEEPLVSEPPTAQVQPVECGPGTQMGPDGTCTVIPAEAGDQNGCLVATAAHGTELAPAVQKLREIRDGALSSTGAGSAFMSAFNSAYYAFSPAVADLERQSPAFRDVVRAAIAPMIHSLQIMEAAESEAQVAAYGLAVIALNLAMYGGAPAAAVYAIRRAASSR